MQENRHYYFVKIKDTFYDQGNIRILEGEKDGFFKIVLYQKLCLLSLKNTGILMLNDSTPYTLEKLRLVLGVSRRRMDEAMKSLLSLGLVEQLEDGRYYVTDIELLVGQSSTEGERKRRERARLRTPSAERTSVPQKTDKCPPIPEIEKEKEIELKPESEIKPEQEGAPVEAQKISPQDFSTNCGKPKNSFETVSSGEPCKEEAASHSVCTVSPTETVSNPPPSSPARSASHREDSPSQASSSFSPIQNRTIIRSIPDKNGMRGEFHNVFLPDSDYRELESRYPSSLHRLIDALSRKLHANPSPLDPVSAIHALAIQMRRPCLC